ncbi:MAG: hypothetical protein NVSMB46_06110 [Candidatus Saccharimonadales bacterium]
MEDKTHDAPNQMIAWSYVIVQAGILGLLVFFNPSFGFDVTKLGTLGSVLELLGGTGVLLSAITIRSSLTAVPLPKKHGRLGTTGLYKYVRHPMYSSVLVLSLGIALHSGNILKYLLVISLFVLFSYKSKYEEHYLRLKYPGYAEYTKRTPRLIPFRRT